MTTTCADCGVEVEPTDVEREGFRCRSCGITLCPECAPTCSCCPDQTATEREISGAEDDYERDARHGWH